MSALLLGMPLACSATLAFCAAFHDAALAMLCEACHQVVDASAHASVLQAALTALWRRARGDDDPMLAFGPVRFSLLIRFAAIVCAAGIALFILLDALLSVLLPGHAHHGADAVPSWTAGVVSAISTLAACAIAASRQRGDRWAATRIATLIGAASVRGLALGDASLSATPPLLRVALSAALRSPDACASVLLGTLALRRAYVEGATPARLLLQMAPREMIPDMEQRLLQARAAPGVLDVREVRLWALDESSAVGSLVAVVRSDADPRVALRHVRRAFDGAPLTLTVQIEHDGVEEDGDLAPFSSAGARRYAETAGAGVLVEDSGWVEVSVGTSVGSTTASSGAEKRA